MKIPSVIKQIQKFVENNGPVILTAAGIAGVGVTGYLCVKAGKLSEIELQTQAELEKRPAGFVYTYPEEIKRTWKLYVPAVVAGLGTAGCMFMATKINLQRLTTLGAVYALSDGNFKEYKAKVEEKLGKKDATALRDSINQDKVDKNPPPESIVVMPDSGKQLCMESWTGRYFLSNIEEIKAAQNRLNYFLVQEGTASLNEFYEYLGLPKTSISENIGWQVSPNNQGMELDFTSTLSPKGEPVLVMDYKTVPFLDFDN